MLFVIYILEINNLFIPYQLVLEPNFAKVVHSVLNVFFKTCQEFLNFFKLKMT
jgi:hypothetical protein